MLFTHGIQRTDLWVVPIEVIWVSNRDARECQSPQLSSHGTTVHSLHAYNHTVSGMAALNRRSLVDLGGSIIMRSLPYKLRKPSHKSLAISVIDPNMMTTIRITIDLERG